MGIAGSRTEGTSKKLGGKIQKGIGKATGNKEMESKGRAKEVEGRMEEEAAKLSGRAKATMEEASGIAKQGIGAAIGDEELKKEGAVMQKKGELRHKFNR
ncbi:hypothetical protein AKJ09_01655 [Labilithrix luteola]|uniref:CsbD-like domain-containing protein n=1 Tax=Labilithrix luteola TaxID=1391654 RepID=A0A0K1PNL8_9BACT|nr:CsbD family protein [Labilithrix luteola]AKU94991.1 hypothetical protein AKJ09_01655 [Labilithrix luteola]